MDKFDNLDDFFFHNFLYINGLFLRILIESIEISLKRMKLLREIRLHLQIHSSIFPPSLTLFIEFLKGLL